jgi:hypothetical protein
MCFSIEILKFKTIFFFQKTVLEFKKQNADSSLPVASMSDTADQMLEIRWFDTVNGTWTNLRGTFTRIANMGKINSFLMHFCD